MTGAAFDFQAPAATPETSAAARFLVLLDESAERFTFQTFDDTGKGRRDLSSIRHGALDALKKYLVELNSAGAGVYVTVNKTDLQGRKAENITHVRAFFVDLDGAPLEPVLAAPITPHIVVESSPKRFHAYWRVADCPLDLFRPIQKALAARFDGDSSVNDLPRIMRLPGFYHCKREPFLTQILSDEPGDVTLAEFCEAFGIDPQEKPPAKHHTEPAASSSMGSWKATVAKIAAVAAERTHQNTGSRHSQSLWIGGELARVGIVSTDEIISYTVECYRRLCRPTNTKGEVAFDVQTAINAVRHGYEKAAKDGELGLKNTLPITPRNDTPADLDALIAALTGDRRQHADEIRAALTAIKADARLDGSKHTASQTIGFALCTEYGGCPDAELGRALCAEWDARTGGNAVTTYRNADPNYQGSTGPVTVDSVFKLARVCGWTGQSEHRWTDPEALPDARPPVMAFDPELMPVSLRDWTVDIAERMQCPPDFPAIAAMISLASLLGRKIGIRPKRHDDWLEVPNLWGAVIGRPGMLKTPALAEAMRPLNRLAAQAREAHEHDARAWEAEKLKLELSAKAIKADAARAAKARGPDSRDQLDNLIHELHQLQNEEDAGPPPERRYLTNDTTVEKLGELLAANPNGLLVFRDELTGWLRQLDKDGQEGARSFYLEAWSGKGRYVFDRIGRGTLHIDSACVSILGGIQPGPLIDYVSAANGQGRGADGLLQRFQLIVWPDDPGTWRNVDRWPEKDARNRAFGVFDYIDNLVPVSIGAQQDDPGEIPYLHFNSVAQGLFDEWRADLERRIRDDLPEAFESHLAKYRKLCPALALLIHLAEGNNGSVTDTAMIKAAAWCEYLETHAARVYAATLQPDITAAHALAAKIKAGVLSNPFKPKDIYRNHWRGLDKTQTTKAIAALEDYGWLRVERVNTGGRPSELCHINPALTGE